MSRYRWLQSRLVFRLCPIVSCVILSGAILVADAGPRVEKKELPTVRWTAGAAGCTFEHSDDGHYRWTMTGPDVTVAVVMDSQELDKKPSNASITFSAHT